MKVVVLANFDVTTVNTNIDFPSIGLWKNYLTGESLQVNSINQSFTLSPGAYKVFINDTLSSGVVTTSVADLNKNEAIGLRIYPNPTQGSCTVDFESQSGSVRVDLYNNFGMQVKNLYSGMTENGFNSIKINYLDQKPGVYFIKLQLNEQNYWESLVVE